MTLQIIRQRVQRLQCARQFLQRLMNIRLHRRVLLQRRLRIGYGRAAHLIDLMEQDGIVGAADGPKPREVLKRPDWISEIEESMR